MPPAQHFWAGRGGWRHPSGGGAGAPRGVPDASWLSDGRCEDHEGLSFTGKIRDPHRRSHLERWAAWRRTASHFLLQGIPYPCLRTRRTIHRVPADLLRCLWLSERPGTSHRRAYYPRFFSHTKVDMEIYLVLYDRASYDTACKLFDGIVSYME